MSQSCSLYLHPHVQTVRVSASGHWNPSQMPADEWGSTRGGTIKDSWENPKGFWRISDLSIKIEWGPNISTLKDKPWGSPFKTRAGCSRGISRCCPAEVTMVVYLSCDKWPILIWFQQSGQLGATTWPAVWPLARTNMLTSPHSSVAEAALKLA